MINCVCVYMIIIIIIIQCSNVVVLFNGGIVCIIDGASLAELIEEKVSNKGTYVHVLHVD